MQVLRLSLLSCPLFLAILAMRLILRRAPKWVCCALWGLLALRLVCPFSLESAWSLLPSQARVDQAIADMTRSYDRSAPEVALPGTAAPEDLASTDTDAQSPAAGQQAGGPGPAAPAQPTATGQGPAPRTGLLSTLWLCGAAGMLLYGAVSYIRLCRRVRTAVWWQKELWQCETVDAPFVLGLFRPRVYLPFYIDPVAAEQIVAHERAHIRRHDQLTKVFAWLLLSVYWFDPLVWAAYSLLCRDIELACDERVVRDMPREARQQYARALLNWGTGKPAVAACPLAFGEVGLKKRIKTVMRYKRPARWATALAAALIAAAGVGLLTSPVAEAVIPPETLQATQADGSGTDAPGVSTAEPGQDTVRAGPDPDAAPDPVPVLTIRPRAISPEEVKAIATAIFGNGAVYEDTGAPEDLRTQYEAAPETPEQEAVERVPCDWTFRPTYEGAPAGDTSIRARAELDGMPYVIQARNYVPPINVTAADIHSLDIDRISQAAVPDAPVESDELCARVNGWLEKAGLEYYAAAAVEQDGAVRVIARPLYDGVPLLPFNSDPLNGNGLLSGYDQTLDFRFSGAALINVHLENPMEMVSSQPVERLRSLQAALAAAGLEDDLAAPDWQFGYVPIPTGNGPLQLVPAYRLGAAGTDGTGEVIVDAVDGSLLADGRTGNETPGSTPTPAPEVMDLEVRWGADGPINYAEAGWFSLSAGQSIDLWVTWYPPIHAVPVWTVDDESVVSIEPSGDGIHCRCELAGASGTETVLHVKVNEMQADIRVLAA